MYFRMPWVEMTRTEYRKETAWALIAHCYYFVGRWDINIVALHTPSHETRKEIMMSLDYTWCPDTSFAYDIYQQ
jgi:hypothetical protein